MVDLHEIVRLAARTGYVLVATAGSDGLPHLAAAHRLDVAPGGQVQVVEWFCPGTMANLEHNRRVSLLVWDDAADAGYQVLGQVESVHELSLLDGVTPNEPPLPAVPQIERELTVRVDQVLDFHQAPHTDEPA